jgi:hypothetical protein
MKKISIRPGYTPYALACAVLLTGGSAFLKNGSLPLAFGSWALLIPLIAGAALDRVEFDGVTIRHRGPLAFLLRRVLGIKQHLSVEEIETITTDTIRLSVATGDVRFNYHTRISGTGIEIVVRSHRSTYVSFVKTLLNVVGPEKLDPRSFELFEYFQSGKSLKNSPVLRNEIASMPMPLLRRAANALRLAGRLSQASSYFRIAYEREPRNPKLLYEMSRFFHSSAQNEDPRLLQRSEACLRLASRLAAEEPDLLERIGEVFFERLDYKRASDCFRRALAADPARFRANVGLAEIALRDGKLAHAAHFYNAAAGSRDGALSKLARREADYYERLVSDDDFLEAELWRIRAANHIRWARRLAAITFLAAWLVGGAVGRMSTIVENYSWALMATCGILWSAATVTLRYLSRRKNYL